MYLKKHDDNNKSRLMLVFSSQTALKTTFRPLHHTWTQPIRSLQKPVIIRYVIDFLESYCIMSHKKQFGNSLWTQLLLQVCLLNFSWQHTVRFSTCCQSLDAHFSIHPLPITWLVDHKPIWKCVIDCSLAQFKYLVFFCWNKMAVYYTFDNTGAMHNGCFIHFYWLNLHSKYLFYQPSVYAFPWNQINFFGFIILNRVGNTVRWHYTLIINY